MRRRPRDHETVRVLHPMQWLWEPLEPDATFVLRSMFGTKAAYLDGKLMLCFSDGDDPWNGILVATSHDHHATLCAEMSVLRPHAILPKWLYLSATVSDFERLAARLVELARQRDPRLGVAPKPRKKRPRPKTRRPR